MKIGMVVLWAAAMVLPPAHALAQGFKPTRPVEIVVHTGPGGGNDVLARVVNGIFEKEGLLPVRANVFNKPGGGGAVAMAYLAEKAGQPHTIAFYSTLWITISLTSREARVPFHELTPIANLVLDPAVVVVRADSPYKTLGDFIEAAKKNPGQLRQAGSSLESRGNLVRQMLQRLTGASWTHIPFPAGGDRIAAILGGHAHILIAEPPEVIEHLNGGTMRVIAQMAEKRLPGYPNVPTIQEAGFNIPNVRTVRGVVGPPGLPKDAVEYWENVFARMVKTDAWRRYLADNHVEDWYLKSAELGKFAEEIAVQRREIFRELGIKTAR